MSGLQSQQTLAAPQARTVQETTISERLPPQHSNENLILFIKAARPDWSSHEVENALERLAKVRIDNVLMLVTALRGKGSWKAGLNAKMEAVGVVGFTDVTLQSLRTQAEVLEQTVKSGQQATATDPSPSKMDMGSGNGTTIGSPSTKSTSQAVEKENPSSIAFQAESQRRAASQRSSSIQNFKVMRPRVDVHTMPCFQSKVIAQKHIGDIISAAEETFDRWVRLAYDIGWIHRGLDESVLVVEGDVPLLAAAEIITIPGPVKFKVVFEPHVPVYSVPERIPEVVLGVRNVGDVVFAETQCYNGWIQLVEGGWMPSLHPEHGAMLSCSGLEKENHFQSQISVATAAISEAKFQLQGHDLDHARAYARHQGWSVHLAELRTERESWLGLRQSIMRSKDNVATLSAIIHDAEKLSCDDEVILIKALIARATSKTSETVIGNAELLQAITDAARSGDLLSAAVARDVAREAGLPKKDIARAFALGNSR